MHGRGRPFERRGSVVARASPRCATRCRSSASSRTPSGKDATLRYTLDDRATTEADPGRRETRSKSVEIVFARWSRRWLVRRRARDCSNSTARARSASAGACCARRLPCSSGLTVLQICARRSRRTRPTTDDDSLAHSPRRLAQLRAPRHRCARRRVAQAAHAPLGVADARGGEPAPAAPRRAAERDGLGRDAFGFLPELSSLRSRRARRRRGRARRARAAPGAARATSRRALARIVGRSLALLSWLGVSDLHWENLVLGVGDRGRVVFAPLDVEMILADLSLPTETKLLPDADPEYAEICRHACGRSARAAVSRQARRRRGSARDGRRVSRHARVSRPSCARDRRRVRAPAGPPRDAHSRVPARDRRVRARALGAAVAAAARRGGGAARARRHPRTSSGLYGRPGIHYYGDRSAHAELEADPARGRRAAARPDPLSSRAAFGRRRGRSCARRGCSRCSAPSITRRSPASTRATSSRSRSGRAPSS